ncbi:Isw2p [Sugiyamaella lignohabitans]|uniref:Isw2p n=1 Tax=Sugiyamaella lignohabitans TaxID=796027 RepID=A0A167EFB2_9ASCO|nr:Isw2p [Sugiyamaella lignohabitans]ANB14004.1 Isw2p [Sugiyamaella lignohabitans]
MANSARGSDNGSGRSRRGRGRAGAASRRRKTEREEDAELLHEEEEEEEDKTTVFTESPAFIRGTLREYQIQGLNWLISLHENSISGILADEMGLGKTLQTISFLGYLRWVRGVEGPHIVIVPKSTLDNWSREFAKWTPEVSVFILQGDKESRAEIINEKLLECDFDICVTSYEMVIREKAHLRKIAWQYIIVDEAHRIKNEESMLSQIIRLFHSRNRLLITGTPLQNNLHELWALLNFLLPDVFSDSQVFDQWFESQGSDQDKVVQQLHKVLRPFLLRRVKADVEKSLLPKKEVNVYIGMSEMQVKWYRKLLEKDIDAVNGAIGKREGKTRLLNIVMQLRKCCNHPYLFEGAEPGPPYTTDEHLVFNCGKMIILDKLLKRMKEIGSRVLIFSQMSRMLDILEDYCIFRDYEYSRIDGSTGHEDRIAAIDDYNKEGSDKFVFLLTTRAGGLGINLTSADIVVLYDSDWNPQADLQAMDRAHRIGQTKQVYVYRFVTENAIEEKVLERAAQKLRLDQLVIQQGRATSSTKDSKDSGSNSKTNAAASKDELLRMIQHGAPAIFENSTGTITSDTSIDSILKHGEERTAELNSRYAKLGLDDLQKFTSDSSAYEWNGQDFAKRNKLNNGMAWINPSKRERKEHAYSIDNYYKEVMATGNNANNNGFKPRYTSGRTPRFLKQANIQDHQFYTPRLRELQEKELAYSRRQAGYLLSEGDITEVDEGQTRQERLKIENDLIKNAEPLTEEEEAEKNELAASGFDNWARRDFTTFIHLIAKHGRHNYEAVAADFNDEDKTADEIKRYSEVFWKRYKEIDGYDKYIAQVEQGEERMRKMGRHKELLRQKIEQYEAPLSTMDVTYPATAKKIYSIEEDRFLLVAINDIGLETENLYEKVRDRISKSPLFRFNWYFQSRTPVELSRRCATLLLAINREAEGPVAAAKRKTGRPGRPRNLPSNTGSPDISFDEDNLEETSTYGTPAAPDRKSKKSRIEEVKDMTPDVA